MNASLKVYDYMLLEYPDANLVLYAVDVIDLQNRNKVLEWREAGRVIYEANFFPFDDVHFGRVIATGNLAYYRDDDFGEVAEFG